MKKPLTLLLLFIAAKCLGQQTSLSLNLTKDSTYNLVTNANLTIIEDIPGHKQVITSLIGAKIAHKVVALRDSVYEMDVQYKRINCSFEMAGKTIGFNSDDSLGSNPASKLIAAMLNKSFTVFISKHCKVLRIEKLDDVVNSAINRFSEASDEKKAQIKAQMKSLLNEKVVTNNFQEAFAVFPAGTLQIGGQWQNERLMENMVAYQLVTSYTLKQITNNSFIIHGDGTFSPLGKGEYMSINGYQMRFYGLKGSGSTDLKLNSATCWVIEGKTSRVVEGTVQIKDTPQTPGGMSFPMSINGDVTVSDK